MDEEAQQAEEISAAESTQAVQDAAEQVFAVEIGGWPMEEVFGPEGDHTDPDVRRGLETFWSILGVAEAYPTQIPTDEAPPQTSRPPGTVHITGHHVLGLGPLHTALECKECGDTVITRSATAAPIPLLGPYLNHEPNRKSDLMNMSLGTVTDGTPAVTYWSTLKEKESHYQDNHLLYFAFPFVPPFYNSNGYTRGLIIASSGNVTLDTGKQMQDLVGGGRPVPNSEFQ